MDPQKSKPESRGGLGLAGERQGASPAATVQPSWGEWLASPAGQYVMRWETEQLSRLVVDMFGYYALQLGFLELDALQANRMPHRIRVKSPRDGASTGGRTPDLLVTGFEELPLESQSVDLVVLPHQLEVSPAPHQLLREADRVLRPEGRLVVVGMNPLSLWGLRQSLSSRPFAPFLPPTGQLIGIPRLRDWMKLLSFEIDSGHYGCYAPPCRTQKWLDRMAFLENAGDRWWPICGAVYMVSAVKRVRGMRLIGPAWKRRPAPKAAPAVAVSGRSISSRSIDAGPLGGRSGGGRLVVPHPAVPGRAIDGPGLSDRTYSRESGVVLPFRRRS
jgi:SAM-dependent methyltransferase